MLENNNDVVEYFNIFERMSQAVHGENMLAIMRAAELMIANCIAQARVDERTKEQTYASVADDVRRFVDVFENADNDIEKLLN